jgi:hypothetical protein
MEAADLSVRGKEQYLIQLEKFENDGELSEK